jgi:glycosyltransferase involved in cell wall biosynthesis
VRREPGIAPTRHDNGDVIGAQQSAGSLWQLRLRPARPALARAHVPLRIAYVTETFPPEINGVAATAARFVDQLRRRGWTVDLVRPRQPHESPSDDVDELLTRGLPLPMYPDLRLGLVRSARLAAHWRATRPALVHVATEGPLGAAAVKAARRLGLPVTSDFRTNFHAYSRHYGFGWAAGFVLGYLRRFHNRTQRCFVPTPALRSTLEQAGFERVAVVGRGIDAVQFAPARRSAALRAAWGADDATPVLLYVGRLAAEKNVALACAAHRAVLRACPQAKLVLVGDGPLRERLQREHPQAIFTGARRGEDLAAHYASADLFLFPSLTDTFGNVVLEALASRLAVVAFADAAAGTHIRDGRNGLLATPGDAAGFTAAAVAAAARFGELAPLRDAARATAESLGWDRIVQGFEGQLLEVVDATGLARAQAA